jgi:hypothetical protein
MGTKDAPIRMVSSKWVTPRPMAQMLPPSPYSNRLMLTSLVRVLSGPTFTQCRVGGGHPGHVTCCLCHLSPLISGSPSSTVRAWAPLPPLYSTVPPHTLSCCCLPALAAVRQEQSGDFVAMPLSFPCIFHSCNSHCCSSGPQRPRQLDPLLAP